MIDARAPLVLCDDARPVNDGVARLFARPMEIVETRDPQAVVACLQRLRRAQARGLHAAGYLSYDAGHVLETRTASLCPAPSEAEPPLLWFGLFETVETISAAAMPALLPDPAGAWSGRAEPRIARSDYDAALATVAEHILAGDIYQANVTFQAAVRTAGDPLALYAALRGRAQAGHGGIVFTGSHWLLSFSPELFFEMAEGRIATRPMKGTATRGHDPATDASAVRALQDDPKQRAENLMIVDLLRNDLARVAKAGSVKVPSLFAVETFPTVHQMTSTVTAQLEDGVDAIDALAAIFPCGSITGAPKIRAMEIIHAVEAGPRGAYTGSIGWIGPEGAAAFNVAIRTLSMTHGSAQATLGLGSGIVADSEAASEWRECLAKGEFVKTERRFDLIETMRFDPSEGVADLERHLARMKASADALGFAFDRHDTRNELQAATFRLRDLRKVRLMLSPSGAVAIETGAMPDMPTAPVDVAIAPLPVAAADFRLRHKTSDRAFYDAARRESGVFETLFVDPGGFLTEGSFTSLFVECGGMLLTPPLGRGLLPGILRARLIDEGRAREADLRPKDLGGTFWIGNALRGLMPARAI